MKIHLFEEEEIEGMKKTTVPFSTPSSETLIRFNAE